MLPHKPVPYFLLHYLPLYLSIIMGYETIGFTTFLHYVTKSSSKTLLLNLIPEFYSEGLLSAFSKLTLCLDLPLEIRILKSTM